MTWRTVKPPVNVIRLTAKEIADSRRSAEHVAAKQWARALANVKEETDA